MKTFFKIFALVAVVPAALLGCGSLEKDRGSSSVYSTGQVMTEQSVRHGVVLSVREVEIKHKAGVIGVGSAAGAVVGAVAAAGNIGQGRGADVAGVLGAVGGSVVGQKIEEFLSSKKGLEITVKLSNNDEVAVTQEVSGESFRAGDTVKLLSSGGVTRVTR